MCTDILNATNDRAEVLEKNSDELTSYEKVFFSSSSVEQRIFKSA